MARIAPDLMPGEVPSETIKGILISPHRKEVWNLPPSFPRVSVSV